MGKIQGRFLVNPNNSSRAVLKYMFISDVRSFDENYNCIVTKTLDADYYLLFNHIDLIITERGSILSHLSIIAMEHAVPIFLAEDIMSKITEKGIVFLENDTITYLADGENA